LSTITRTLIILSLCLFGTLPGKTATYYAVVTGNWSALTTWSTVACGNFTNPLSIPSATDDVIVCNGVALTCNINTSIINLTVSNGGTFQNAGSNTSRTLTVNGQLTLLGNGILIQNSIINASTTLFNGVENFSATSTVDIRQWSSFANSIVSGVDSNFGNVKLNLNTGISWWVNQGLGVSHLILGDLEVGSTCQSILDNGPTAINITIGNNLIIDGKLKVKDSNTGTVNFIVNGAGTFGATGWFAGIANGFNNFTFNISSLTTGTGSTFNGLLDGIGNANITINGVFNCAGDFYGINAPNKLFNGVPAITIQTLAYTGGIFMATNTHNLNGLATVSVLSHATINFTAANNKIALIGLASLGGNVCTTRLLFYVGGNLTVTGVSTCEFKTSESRGEESTNIVGTFTFTGARTIFNGSLSESNGHKVNIKLGSLLSSGGSVWFSENASDSTFLTVNGLVQLSGGTAILKSSTGFALFTVNGNYTQNLVSSVFYMHGVDQFGISSASNDRIELKVNGDFVQSGGIIYFDSFDSPSEQVIRINGANYTISNSATMQRAGSGSSNNFAKIEFEYQGTISYFRNLSHNILQCKQVVKAGCLLNVISGPLQISSHNSPQLAMLTIDSAAVLSIGTFQISSDTIYPHTGITVANGARLRLAKTQGLYDGTNNPVLRSSGGMNYFLGVNSIVEYNTNTYARVSGINVGVAVLAQHKYGILEINHVGPSSTWISPTYLPSFTNAIYVRTRLIITAGEFNLCDAPGNPGSAGRYVFIENPNPNALVRTGGFIRSEALNHSGRIVWTISNVIGTYTVPFGYSTADYIPLTYTLTGGNAGTVSFSTYRTPTTNLPWPSGVTNLASHIGLSPDNRQATVDRFWRISATGTTQAVNLNFSYIASELPSIPFNVAGAIRAHAYNSSTNAWMAATTGQSASAYQVSAPNANIAVHWALSSLNSALPLEWLSINAISNARDVKVNWSTLSEKDCDYFSIYKRDQTSEFQKLGEVATSGNSNSIKNYSFIDIDASQKDAYYRIKETDMNGDEFWSDIVFYKATHSSVEPKVWYHHESGLLELLLPLDQNGNVFIYDLSGRLLFEQLNVKGTIYLPVSLMLGNTYIFRFVNDQMNFSSKLSP